jgi:hypothetical protein
MADLRVLEQQQNESFRKLEAIKLTKQHKQSQHSSLESKLSSLKYANGEQRAQLVRSRDVLSRSTREMGATKLSSSKSSDSLKAFDSRLKKALTSKRILNALRHKVDSGIITLRNKRAIILRLKTQVADELTASTKRANDAKNHEDSLRKSIQDEKYETKNIIEDITSARSEVTGLGQDLANNHITLEDTKSRAECTMSDLVAEDKRHDSFMKQEYSKLEAYKKQEAEKKAREQEVLKEIELKRTQLLQSWKRCVQLQQEEGHELSPEPTEDAATPTLDVDKLQAVLDEEQAALLSDKTKRDDVNKSLTAAREEVASLESKDTAVLEEMESTTNATDDAQKVENDRKKANSKFLDELEKDRYSVRDLRRSVSELEESIGSERKRLDDRYAEQSEMIEKRQTEVEESKAELADALTTHQDLEGRFEEKQKSDSRLLEKAKREADSTRSDFEEARLQVEALKNAPDTDIQKEVEDIQQAQSILVEDTKDEIEQLCEGKCVVVLLCTLPTVSILFLMSLLLLSPSLNKDHPALAEIEIDFDADMTTDELADESLADLKADCAARVEQARLQKEAERKKIALKKEKEAEASRKRKEERRNERKRREQAKQQELNDGKHKRPSRDGAGILASTQDVADDEPIPASQKTIRFEDEEEIGSLVTNLSAGRSRETKRTYGKSGRSSTGSSRSVKSKSKKTDGKERPSSIKESSRSRSSTDEKLSKSSKSRDSSVKRSKDSSSVRTKNSSSLTSSSKRSRVEGKSKKVESHETSKSSSLVDAAENRHVNKRSKDSTSVAAENRPENKRSKDSSSVRKSHSSREKMTKDSSSSAHRKASSSRSVTSSSSKKREKKTHSFTDRKTSDISRPPSIKASSSSPRSSRDTNRKSSGTKPTSSLFSATVSSSKKRKADCGSQVSGISTGERAHRRRKKSGASSKSKSSKLNAFGGFGEDVDFTF